MQAAVPDSEIDWSDCSDVERLRGRISGRWVVKDSRIMADGNIENFDAGASPEEIGEEIYDGLGAERARKSSNTQWRTSGSRSRTPEARRCRAASASTRRPASACVAFSPRTRWSPPAKWVGQV